MVWVWVGVGVLKNSRKRGRELACKKELNPRAGELKAVEVRKRIFQSILCGDFKF